ncbi:MULTISPECIES: hypothetical protein [unclassified Streptomyces]|uniref:hypothetical protein n=1 Tax=unclassified Streptomyces TaxID=2593676 RepID=UPI0022AF74EA|nr:MULTISPECIES: hypothetical protein [unclassified Streptomyces]MCZ4097329.1 hypothetical protein [Streptomyces sp. H39-C1]MCZ4120633.1 hypothetical protein [Streptomyces sp. H39-S7]
MGNFALGDWITVKDATSTEHMHCIGKSGCLTRRSFTDDTDRAWRVRFTDDSEQIIYESEMDLNDWTPTKAASKCGNDAVRRIVLISDLQMPLEHQRANRSVINFIHDYQPDEVINIGDITDYTSPSRWSAGRRAEYGMTVRQEADYTRRKHLDPLRQGYSGPYTLLGSNHGERPRKYLVERAPALYDDEAYREDKLLDLDDYGIAFEPLRYDFAPGWAAIHGHTQGISLSRHAGGTAINAARRLDRNVVMGHTHRAGIVNESTGSGASKTLTGVELGHLMDIRKAEYLGAARFANWQMSIGLFYVDGKNVTPHLIPVRSNGSFIAEGEYYS